MPACSFSGTRQNSLQWLTDRNPMQNYNVIRHCCVVRYCTSSALSPQPFPAFNTSQNSLCLFSSCIPLLAHVQFMIDQNHPTVWPNFPFLYLCLPFPFPAQTQNKKGLFSSPLPLFIPAHCSGMFYLDLHESLLSLLICQLQNKEQQR